MFAPIAFGLGGALLVWAVSLLIPDRYTSAAMVRLELEPFPTADVINLAWQEVVSRKNLKNLIERFNLYPNERDRLPLEDVIEDAKKNDITLDIPPDHDVRVAFTYPDPATAQAVANDIMKTMVTVADDNSRREPGWGRLEMKQAPGPAEAASTGLAFWRPRRYVAHGTLAVKKLDTFVVDPKAAAKRTEELKQSIMSLELLARVVSQFKLYSSGPDGASPELVAQMIRDLRFDPHTNVVTIKFTYPDAQIAQKTVNALVTRVTDAEIVARRKMPECMPSPQPASPASNAQRIMPYILSPDVSDSLEFTLPLKSTTQSINHVADQDCRDANGPEAKHVITILDPASLPDQPDGPSHPILAAFGFFLGLGLWAAVKN